MTNHSYFNLKGENSKHDITGHKIKFNSCKLMEWGLGFVPTGQFIDTKGSIFDFTNFRSISENID